MNLLIDSEHLMANLVKYFVEGGEYEKSRALYPATLEIEGSGASTWLDITLRGPRITYDALKPNWDDHGEQLNDFFRQVEEVVGAMLPRNYSHRFSVGLEVLTPDSEWRSQVAKITDEKIATNQNHNIPGRRVLLWQNLRFNSEVERRIANALDASRVLFFPNCIARLNTDSGRGNRIPDFLVCDKGKWGILEVDGREYHPSAAEDHDRDRLFKAYSIKVVERYKADRCYADALGVVQQFLTLLQRNG